MLKAICTITLLSISLLGVAQDGDRSFQSTPEAVMEEIFRAAREKDYSNLEYLCPPMGGGDGDTRYICQIASSSRKEKKEFISYFENAKITGETDFQDLDGGEPKAIVPFWFNHPGGESRSNEKMHMVQLDGKWYLASF